MTTMLSKSISKPKLIEASALPSTSKVPGCVIDDGSDEFQIILNLSGAVDSSLQLYTSADGHRIHVIGEKWFSDSISKYLWSFDLPRNVDSHKISFDRSQDIYLIHIPKLKFWARVEQIFNPASQEVKCPGS